MHSPTDSTDKCKISIMIDHNYYFVITGRYYINCHSRTFFSTLKGLVDHYSQDADGLCCRLTHCPRVDQHTGVYSNLQFANATDSRMMSIRKAMVDSDSGESEFEDVDDDDWD